MELLELVELELLELLEEDDEELFELDELELELELLLLELELEEELDELLELDELELVLDDGVPGSVGESPSLQPAAKRAANSATPIQPRMVSRAIRLMTCTPIELCASGDRRPGTPVATEIDRSRPGNGTTGVLIPVPERETFSCPGGDRGTGECSHGAVRVAPSHGVGTGPAPWGVRNPRLSGDDRRRRWAAGALPRLRSVLPRSVARAGNAMRVGEPGRVAPGWRSPDQ